MKPWRVAFVLSGVLIVAGVFLHPRGESWAVMLADPRWVPGHLAVLVAMGCLLFGLSRLRRDAAPSSSLDRWTLWAMIGAGLYAIEMVLHTAAAVDAGRLAAGEGTPVFSTHMMLATLFYPAFGVTLFGWIWVASRNRMVGSPWIAWLGMLGVGAHGLAPFLVGVLGLTQLGIFFPMIFFFGLWLVIAAAWPARAGARREAPVSA